MDAVTQRNTPAKCQKRPGLYLMLCCIALSGCAGLATYQPRNADEAIRMAKQAGGTGCYYARVKGNARPYADVEATTIVVSTVGKGTTFLECLEALPPEARALVRP